MAYVFADEWADEIVAVTDSPEFQTAQIRIYDPSQATLVTPYDIDTDTPAVYSGGDIYEGRARIIGVRWGVFHGGESQANASTEKAIRIQLPFQAVGRVKKGVKVFIESSPRNPVLEQLLFVVTNDFQGSMSATRTIECSLDGDVEVA